MYQIRNTHKTYFLFEETHAQQINLIFLFSIVQAFIVDIIHTKPDQKISENINIENRA